MDQTHESVSNAEKVEARRVKRRNRSKISQRKYRANQKASNKRLEEDVQSLQMDTLHLEAQRAVLHEHRGVIKYVDIVREYFSLFKYGYSLEHKDVDRTCRQEAFLFKYLAPNFVLMNQSGPKALLDQWKQHTETFGTSWFDIDHVEVLSVSEEVIVEASVFLHVHLKKASISNIFPRLVNREDLIEKLDGKKLKVPIRANFAFDPITDKIMRLTITANIAAALIGQLNCIEDACAALRGFLVEDNVFLFMPEMEY